MLVFTAAPVPGANCRSFIKPGSVISDAEAGSVYGALVVAEGPEFSKIAVNCSGY